jgi:hypothetical protein
MSPRILGSASQSVSTPDLSSEDVDQSRTAAASRTSAATLKAQEESQQLDSIEHAGAREGLEGAEAGPGHASGPAVSGHLLHMTGGKSGHEALEEKGPSGNAIRDGNWVSHGRTLRNGSRSGTIEREGLRPKVKADPAKHSREEKATSHRQKGGPKREASATLWKTEDRSFNLAKFHVAEGKNGSISLFQAQGQAGAKFAAGDGAFKLEAGASAAANLVNVEAHGEHKGTVNLKGAAHLNLGARAEGKATAEIDLKKMTVAVKGGVDAFAGGSVGVNGSAEAGGVEVGAAAKAEAGIGFQANGTLGFEDGKLKFGGDIGACVGVGADVKFNVEIDARKIAQEAAQAGQYLETKEQALAGAVEQAALDGVASAASHAFSFLQKASAVAHAVESGAEALAEAAGQS